MKITRISARFVRQNELVYLFGTGISAALTGKNYSWKKWILDGTGYFSDRKAADDIAESLQKDSSTKNLLNAVKTVLAVTKQERKYDQWMHRSFEVNRVTNQNLAETLKKLLITQDVFATTNYDHLLEQTTGLAALSYADTQQAFYMLDQRKSNAVLHIHGEYDSIRGIDNIIADEEQYRTILNDKGAQFLQQILGTRTLIFVGCGQIRKMPILPSLSGSPGTICTLTESIIICIGRGKNRRDCRILFGRSLTERSIVTSRNSSRIWRNCGYMRR